MPKEQTFDLVILYLFSPHINHKNVKEHPPARRISEMRRRVFCDTPVSTWCYYSGELQQNACTCTCTCMYCLFMHFFLSFFQHSFLFIVSFFRSCLPIFFLSFFFHWSCSFSRSFLSSIPDFVYLNTSSHKDCQF